MYWCLNKQASPRKKYRVSGLHLISVLTGIGLLAATGVRAEGLAGSSPWQITADRISRFTHPDVVVAEGNVVLTRVAGEFARSVSWPGENKESLAVSEDTSQAVTIKGDWVRFDPLTKVVKVRGEVALDSEEEKIVAESAVLDLDDHTGTLSKATLYFPKRELLLAGDVVQKTGELTYHFESGWASKCGPQEDKSPPWSFGWKEANIADGGFASFKHITFRIKDTPVFYSPYFAFSSNRQRKTGLLLPEISQSTRDGAGVLQPLFLNLSPSYDLTLYGGYLTSRGPQTGAEFRYVLDNNSRGMLAVNYLQDDLNDFEDDFKSDQVYRTTENRYWIRGKVNHEFGHEIHGKLDLDLVSDQDYLQEFKKGMIGYDESQKRFRENFHRGFDSETTFARTNVGQLSRSWMDTSFNGELRIIDDSTKVASTAHLWSLPRIVGGGRLPVFNRMVPRGALGQVLGDTDLAWDSEYVYYWQENGVGGHRLDLNPRLVVPLRFIPYLESSVSAGVRETLYNVDDNSPTAVGFDSGLLSRTLQEYTANVSSVFVRKFSGHWGGYRQLSHMVRPRIKYDYIPGKNQAEFPGLDATDQIMAKNLVTYEVANDFDLFGVQNNGLEKTRKFAYLTIGQSYDFEEENRVLTGVTDASEPFSPVNFDLRIYPVEGLSITSDSFWDVYGRGFVQYEILSHYTAREGYSLGVEYRFDKDAAVDQLNANFSMDLTDYLKLEGGFLHSFEINETSEATLGMIYSPNCWSVEMLGATTVDNDYRFSVMFSLTGIGKVGGYSKTLMN